MNTKSFGLGTFHGDLSTDKREKANNVSVTRRFINNACWCRINTFCHLMAGDISNVIFLALVKQTSIKANFIVQAVFSKCHRVI